MRRNRGLPRAEHPTHLNSESETSAFTEERRSEPRSGARLHELPDFGHHEDKTFPFSGRHLWIPQIHQ